MEQRAFYIIIIILQFLLKISKCIYFFVFVNEMMTFYSDTSMLNKLWNIYEKYIEFDYLI